jgi:error-prone DNA polymerase
MLLNNHTYFSLRYGTISPTDLLEMAESMGEKQLVVTDINNSSSTMDVVRMAQQKGIKPIVGIDFRRGARQLYVALAKNNEGFQELNAHLSEHLHNKTEIEETAPPFKNAFVIYPLAQFSGQKLSENEFIGIAPHEKNKLLFTSLKEHRSKCVVLKTNSFRNKKDFNAHRLLRAIDNNTLLSKLQKTEEGLEEDVVQSTAQVTAEMKDFPDVLENTNRLLQECEISFDFAENRVPKNLSSYTSSVEEDYEMVKRLCEEGMEYRYGKNPSKETLERVEKELSIIKQKNFLSYFLINWDIVKYARGKGYFYVGRGSGANSVIAYLLQITDVDPIELDLYFERFINLYRTSPPDFDIDFSWADRDDVTNYIFDRFENTALLATYNTFQYRATVREIGKVFGLPKREIDVLSTGRFNYNDLDKFSQLTLKYSQWIEGFPNHLSVHAGGILISEKPIDYYSATFLPPKGFPTTQFDMVIAEDVGLYKFDILSQRGLGKIHDSIQIIADNRPDHPPIDIHDIKRLKEDEKIKELLKEGLTIGCFYVESPAMRMLLKKLQVKDYLGLVAASSVIRPGVAKSGMMREYILRYRFPEKRKEAHPVLFDLMPETYGVMVYQEDVIKVAHYFAGLTLGEADVLRRGMSGKFRSRGEFQSVKENFFKKCKEKGHEYKFTADVWRQIESFAGYAFAKGHSASYAVESYQSLFLKAYYPLEYMVATLNNGGGFYSAELYAHEARMQGATIHEPEINSSDALSVIKSKDIYLGLGRIRDLDSNSIRNILIARYKGGEFASLQDFLNRVEISLEQLKLLIRCGVFKKINASKKDLMWEAHFFLGHTKKSHPEANLFEPQPKSFELPNLITEPYEDAFDEIELLGFPLRSPFALLLEDAPETVLAADLPKYIGKTVSVLGYHVHTKQTNTSKGDRMNFGTFIDSAGHFIDSVHFPRVSAKYPFRGKGIYKIVGEVLEEFDTISLQVNSMELMPIIQDPRYAELSQHERQMLTKPKKKDVYKR